MSKTLLVLTIVMTALLVAVAAQADVHNVTLSAVGDSGITGTATTIIGTMTGPSPITNAEINVKLNQAPPSGQVYQAWLVDSKDNYKLSLGAFNGMMFSSRQQLVSFSPYDSIAISQEPANDMNPMPGAIVAQGGLPGNMVTASNFATQAIVPSDESYQMAIVQQRYGLSNDQVINLRMQGFSFDRIALMANAASQCNKSVNDIASMLMQGQTWDQIASSCNTTVAALMQPVPMQAVAGFVGEVTPGMAAAPGMVQVPVVYRRYANGRAVVTQDMWNMLADQGYSWRDVAVAANIAAVTGEDVHNLLRMVRIQGRTWRSIIVERGMDPDETMDVSQWPFGEEAGEMPRMPQTTTVTPAPMPPSGPTY